MEGDLRREVSMNIKRLMDLGCCRQRSGTGASSRCAASAQAAPPTPGHAEGPRRLVRK